MKYDFDTVVDRGGNRSAKYDERMKKFGTDQVIPLWIADMDFKTAQPIVDALTARAQEGIWGYTSRPGLVRVSRGRGGTRLTPAGRALCRRQAVEGGAEMV